MDLKSEILTRILIIPGILIGFTIHEYAHAWMADRLGDKTPKFQGRLTLNPIAHIDPVGFLMFIVAYFGWAKPVETNPRAYKNYYKDDLKVSIAGVIGNLIVAIVLAIALGLYVRFVLTNSSMAGIIEQVLWYGIKMNCVMVVFNLLPLPGLDGFHILRDLFPKFFYDKAEFLYKYQMVILAAFIFLPFFRYVIDLPVAFLFKNLLMLARIIA